MTNNLKQQYEELSFLCLNYDPSEPSLEEGLRFLLEKYHLTHIDDPFMVTNELLQMLDQCQAEINRTHRVKDSSSREDFSQANYIIKKDQKKIQ